MWAAQHPETYLGARYRRISTRRGAMRANVAVQHAILIAIWHMATTGALYDEPGPDWYTRQHPERAKRQAIRTLDHLGFDVTITARGAA